MCLFSQSLWASHPILHLGDFRCFSPPTIGHKVPPYRAVHLWFVNVKIYTVPWHISNVTIKNIRLVGAQTHVKNVVSFGNYMMGWQSVLATVSRHQNVQHSKSIGWMDWWELDSWQWSDPFAKAPVYWPPNKQRPIVTISSFAKQVLPILNNNNKQSSRQNKCCPSPIGHWFVDIEL